MAQCKVRRHLPARHENGRELQAGLTRYFDFYSRRRIHQSHEYQVPDETYHATTVGEPLAIAACKLWRGGINATLRLIVAALLTVRSDRVGRLA